LGLARGLLVWNLVATLAEKSRFTPDPPTSMKLKVILAALVLLQIPAAHSAVSITQLGQAYTENFSTFDGTAIPANFESFGSGFPNLGGYYNRDGSYSNSNLAYALRDNASATETAFGMKRPSNTNVAALNWLLENNTGASITTLTITWDAWQVSAAGRATELVLFNYNGGSGFTSTGLTSTTYTATTGSPDANLASITVSAQSATIEFATPVADGETITLGWRWLQGAGSGGNAHVGLTNLSVTAVPEPTAALLGSFGLLALLRRRR
jgi:hypothetical protein